MVTEFDISNEDVSYEGERLIYANTHPDVGKNDAATLDGFNWRLELPFDPDPTVEITDDGTVYQFTYVEQIRDEDFYRAVHRVEL